MVTIEYLLLPLLVYSQHNKTNRSARNSRVAVPNQRRTTGSGRERPEEIDDRKKHQSCRKRAPCYDCQRRWRTAADIVFGDVHGLFFFLEAVANYDMVVRNSSWANDTTHDGVMAQFCRNTDWSNATTCFSA
eukprot:scpid39767/ scgid33996/ 